MAYGLIQDTTLQDLGSALREQLGETRLEPEMSDHFTYKTTNMDSFDSTPTGIAYGLSETTFTVPEAVKMVVRYCTNFENGTAPIDFYINGVNYRSYERVTKEEVIEGNSVTLKAGSTTSASRNGVYSEIYAYDANDNKLVFDTGTMLEVPNTFTVAEMADTIRGISIIPEAAFVVSGNCEYKFAYGSWSWFLDNFGDKIETKDISSMGYLFSNNSSLTRIPFEINIKDCIRLTNAFYLTHYLKECPKIRGTIQIATSTTLDSLLYANYRLRDAEDLFDPKMFDAWSTYKWTSSYSGPRPNNFYNCYSLRKVPSWWYKFGLNPESTAFPAYSYTMYYNGFNGCYNLDEVLNMPVLTCTTAQTSNMFNGTFTNCSRIKDCTFETDNGQPIEAKWKAQTIDLSGKVGYTSSSNNMTAYNSGITTDKQVTDTTTYEALKNDPDWYTTNILYSRYNHEAAVRTIRSLPDTSAYLASAGGTNTIKFAKTCGTNTDGGPCSALTAEEIAIAAAKGWTVTLS